MCIQSPHGPASASNHPRLRGTHAKLFSEPPEPRLTALSPTTSAEAQPALTSSGTRGLHRRHTLTLTDEPADAEGAAMMEWQAVR